MPIPKLVRRGEIYTVTMMEFRKQPGEVIDACRDGALVKITKQGKHVATMVPTGFYFDPDRPIVIRSDGTSEDGRMPLMLRRSDLGSFY
jgi:hypothetical protein